MSNASSSEPYVLPFSAITLDSLPQVGGKNASLGEMVASLTQAGVRVPDGFATSVAAFRLHMERAGLAESVYEQLDGLDVRDTKTLARVAGAIREQIEGASLPEELSEELARAYTVLSRSYGGRATDVAVRSSATAEDLPTASFAGQHESFLNVRGVKALDRAVRACMASMFTDRAIVYRSAHGIAHRSVGLSVGVQKMVRSDKAAAGVIFTLDTESGFRDVVTISGSWGLGESVVKGRVNPDEFWVHKPTLRAGHRPIIKAELGDKRLRLAYATHNGATTREVTTIKKDRERLVLTTDEVLQLARWALLVEDHYSAHAGHAMAMDLEWAKDGRSGELFIVQARPETVYSQRSSAAIDVYTLKGSGEILARGKSVGNKIGAGEVRNIDSVAELDRFHDGDVLVAKTTDPDWEPILRKAAAVVTEQGGRTCHAAIVSREAGIPCVVGAMDARERLRDGVAVTVSCAEGDEGRVYEGRLDFDVEHVDPASLPESPVPLMFNLADPGNALRLAQLPSAGVGLMRIEFLVSSRVGIHPMALVHPERLARRDLRAVKARTRTAASPSEFFVEQLASGVATIAAAFYPRPVIVRFSDFKSNEYAGLIGGSVFEVVESNPMIGFRGASRYYDERYREGFALECEAIRRVREVMGLDNVKVMIPFCRTLEEGERVLAEMQSHGLVRGRDGLEVYVMCEIPNNVILADEFSRLFDGFSIGSNDLTQLTLGVDRDSELLAHVFDERDVGVKRFIEQVVAAAHDCGRPVGICGEAPSNYPEFAVWLAEIGIDSISLNPDSLLTVTRRLSSCAQRASAVRADHLGAAT